MASFFSTMPGANRQRGRRRRGGPSARRRRKGSLNDDDEADDETLEASDIPSFSMGGTWVNWPDWRQGVPGEGIEGRTAARERNVYMFLHLVWVANIITSAVIAKFASDYIASYEDPGDDVDGTQVEVQTVIKNTANMLKYFPAISVFFGIFYLFLSWLFLSRRTKAYPTFTEHDVKVLGKGVKSLTVVRLEWFLLAVHFIIYFVIGFVLYYKGSHRDNTDNGKGIELESECSKSNNFFCSDTVGMSNAVWAAAVFSFLSAATMSYIWHAHPGEEAPSYSVDLSLRFLRNAYYFLGANWIIVAILGCVICGYASAYQDEYLKDGPEQNEIYDLVKTIQGFSGALLAGLGAIYAFLVIWTTKRYTNEEHHEHSSQEGIHSLNITWVEFLYTIITFILVMAFAIALAVGGWRGKRLNTKRGFAMYMSCDKSDKYCKQTTNLGVSLFVAGGFLFPAVITMLVILYKHPVRKALERDEEDGMDEEGSDVQARAAGLVRRPAPSYNRAAMRRQPTARAGPSRARRGGDGMNWCQEPGCRNNCRKGAGYCRRHA